MGKDTKFALIVASVLVFSGAVIVTMVLPAMKPAPVAETQMKYLPDEIHIDVSPRGYFVRGGNFISKTLRLQRGRHVKIIFHYDYPASDAELPSHQFTILAPKTQDREEFRLQSESLTSMNREVVMELNVGENNIDRYLLGCSISCDAMAQLFREIEVIG
ncbi:MAG: hypothetical protein Q7J45_04275 [bacterium]|nr:hypothetical protein [bacterium]